MMNLEEYHCLCGYSFQGDGARRWNDDRGMPYCPQCNMHHIFKTTILFEKERAEKTLKNDTF
jgi:NAD-dependent SIR2 family protein deacetylase